MSPQVTEVPTPKPCVTYVYLSFRSAAGFSCTQYAPPGRKSQLLHHQPPAQHIHFVCLLINILILPVKLDAQRILVIEGVPHSEQPSTLLFGFTLSFSLGAVLQENMPLYHYSLISQTCWVKRSGSRSTWSLKDVNNV